MAFEILMNGVGDSFSVRHYGTNFLVHDDVFLLAVDCPDSYRRALTEHEFVHDGKLVTADTLDALFLTHLHGDHVNGLEMLLAYRRFVTRRKLTIYTTPDVAEVLWERRLQVSLGTMWDGQGFETMAADDFFDLHVVPWQQAYPIGPFRVQTRRTLHHIPTAALRIDDGVSTLGYSCDTAFDPELIAWLEDADLILHETSLGPAHTPLTDLLAMPRQVRDKTLVVHYPDALIGADIEMEMAVQGQAYAVGN